MLCAKYINVRYLDNCKKKKINDVIISLWPETALCKLSSYGFPLQSACDLQVYIQGTELRALLAKGIACQHVVPTKPLFPSPWCSLVGLSCLWLYSIHMWPDVYCRKGYVILDTAGFIKGYLGVGSYKCENGWEKQLKTKSALTRFSTVKLLSSIEEDLSENTIPMCVAVWFSRKK